MRVMAFASHKGGSGKTTLAGHTAVQAERAGAGPVGLIDTDAHGSLSDRWNARPTEQSAGLWTDLEIRMQRLARLPAGIAAIAAAGGLPGAPARNDGSVRESA